MDLLDRLLEHDAALTHAVLACSRDLSDAQLDQEFDIGLRSLRATYVHYIGNVATWTDLMAGRMPVRPPADPPPSIATLTERFDLAHAAFRTLARETQAAGRMDATFVDVLDNPPQEKTLGGGIAHLITHSMLHRTEVFHILQRLGVPNLPDEDVLTWEASLRQQE